MSIKTFIQVHNDFLKEQSDGKRSRFTMLFAPIEGTLIIAGAPYLCGSINDQENYDCYVVGNELVFPHYPPYKSCRLIVSYSALLTREDINDG